MNLNYINLNLKPKVIKPYPVLVEHEGITVVRDDMFLGGTKRRVFQTLMEQAPFDTFVYPATAIGMAAASLGYVAEDTQKRVVAFIAKRDRKNYTSIMEEAIEAGGKYFEFREVNMGFYKNVVSAARKYASINNHFFIESGGSMPFGVDVIGKVAERIVKKHGQFDVVYSACSSGTLIRGLQQGGLGKKYVAVGTGIRNPNCGDAKLIEHYKIEKFEKHTKNPPPFPTFLNYDGKVWQYAKKDKSKRVLMWNVAATQEQYELFKGVQ